ncbi:MAG: methyl-accepting chemotaxis protein [Bacteroides sp.]
MANQSYCNSHGSETDVNQWSQKSYNSVEQITEKVRIITEIASQTNILALNAAVEELHAKVHTDVVSRWWRVRSENSRNGVTMLQTT